jgi:hypothetical protein
VNCISICCAARSSTAQPCDTSLNNFIRLGLGAVLRASVRRHRSRLILGCFGRSDRRAQTRPGIVPTSPDSRGWQLDTGQPARGRVGSHRENEDTTSSPVPSEFSRRFLFLRTLSRMDLMGAVVDWTHTHEDPSTCAQNCQLRISDLRRSPRPGSGQAVPQAKVKVAADRSSWFCRRVARS